MSGYRSRTIMLIMLGAGAAGLVIAANLWKAGLKVRNVSVEGTHIVVPNELLQLAQVSVGMPLYQADLTVIQRNVMSHHYVQDAVVERDLPATIRIRVTERTPIALMNRPELYYLDEDGVILPHSISKALFDLPVVSGVVSHEPLRPGRALTQAEVLEALTLLAVLKETSKDLFHRISEVHVRGDGDMVLFAAEEGIPIVFGRGDMAAKLSRLETFWSDVVREHGTRGLQYVDLRYEDQVVVRWNLAMEKARKL